MQFLIDRGVSAKLLPSLGRSAILDVAELAGIENSSKDAWRLSFERNRFSEPPGDDLAVELVLDAVVEEDGTAFDLEQVAEHLDEAREVELDVVVEGDVLGDEEQGEGVLESPSGLEVEVVLG